MACASFEQKTNDNNNNNNSTQLTIFNLFQIV